MEVVASYCTTDRIISDYIGSSSAETNGELATKRSESTKYNALSAIAVPSDR